MAKGEGVVEDSQEEIAGKRAEFIAEAGRPFTDIIVVSKAVDEILAENPSPKEDNGNLTYHYARVAVLLEPLYNQYPEAFRGVLGKKYPNDIPLQTEVTSGEFLVAMYGAAVSIVEANQLPIAVKYRNEQTLVTTKVNKIAGIEALATLRQEVAAALFDHPPSPDFCAAFGLVLEPTVVGVDRTLSLMDKVALWKQEREANITDYVNACRFADNYTNMVSCLEWALTRLDRVQPDTEYVKEVRAAMRHKGTTIEDMWNYFRGCYARVEGITEERAAYYQSLYAAIFSGEAESYVTPQE